MESQAVEPVGVTNAEALVTDLGEGTQQSQDEEVQPVPRMAPETFEPPKKYLGEFDDEGSARVELEKLRSFKEAVSRDHDVQALVQARQEAQRQAERQKLAVQGEEQRILESYAEAVSQGNPDKALLTLVREIRGQARNDAQAAIRQELNQATEPLRAKAQLLESTSWQDLHPIADEATWLATELAKLGHSKPAVAEFLRNVGKKYGGGSTIKAVDNPLPQAVRRARGPGLESPDSGGNLDKVSEKGWDRFVDDYWTKQGY